MCKTKPTNPAGAANETVTSSGFDGKRSALAAMLARIEEFVDAVPQRLWRTRPAAGGFSLVEQVCHLRDIDGEGYRLRLERILTEHEPSFPNIDGAKLARERDYQEQDLPTALAGFGKTRADISHRLNGLSNAARQRAGFLDGTQRITIDDLVAAMLDHDRGHLQELAALRDELRLRKD
ncbi:MAG: DinB family protein [Proteobacteria bacterium]|nr:DinB family protein [Pseudomonadota bacterium]